jgi:hypothetical protein
LAACISRDNNISEEEPDGDGFNGVGYPIPVDDLFNLNTLGEITIKISLDQWNENLRNNKINIKAEEIVRADDFIYKDGDGNTINYENVSFRIRGGDYSRFAPEVTNNNRHNNSRPRWQATHFKIGFDKFTDIDPNYGDRKFLDKWDGLILKWFKEDPMFVREIYSYNLYARYGIWTAARVKYAKLYIHVGAGEVGGDTNPAYFGMYAMIEDFSKDMITQRLSKNIDKEGDKGIGYSSNNGNLWKCVAKAGSPTLELVRNIDDLMGVEITELHNIKFYTYDLKTNKREIDTDPKIKNELKQFITDLNNKTGDDFKNWVAERMDIDLFLKTIAVEVVNGQWDDYWVNANNYYLYFDTNGKVYYLPYDCDNTLGTSNEIPNAGTQNPLRWGTRDTKRRPLITKILNVPEYEAKYKKYLRELINPEYDLFYVDKSIARIRGWHSLISDHLNSHIVEGVGYLTYKGIADKPPHWAGTSFYRLLTGNDTTNYFRAKARAINRYCR